MFHNIALILQVSKTPADWLIEDFPTWYQQYVDLAKISAAYIAAGGIFVLVVRSLKS